MPETNREGAETALGRTLGTPGQEVLKFNFAVYRGDSTEPEGPIRLVSTGGLIKVWAVCALLCALGAARLAEGAPQLGASAQRRRLLTRTSARTRTRRIRRAAKLKPGDDFQVELLTPQIEVDIGARPGTYPAEEPVRLRVTSSSAGWGMQVKCTKLKLAGIDMIAASEVWMLDGEWFPLHKPRDIVKNGPAGETIVEIELAIVTTSMHELGYYEGELLVGSQQPSGGTSPLIKVPFGITVSARATHSYSNHQMYFHFGHLDESLSAIVDGAVSSDMEVALSLAVEDGGLDRLPLAKGVLESVPQDATVPVAWRLRESSSLFRPPDHQALNGSEMSWTLSGTPGDIAYELECTVAPTTYQPPGDYGMAVVITLVPVL